MNKICIYCPVFFPQNGGYANAFQNLIKVISIYGKAKIEIDIITPEKLNTKDELLLDSVSVIRIDDKPFIDFFNFPKLIRVFFSAINYFLQPYFRYRELKKILDSNKYDLILFETLEDILLLTYLDKKYFENLAVRIHATEETEGVVFKNDIYSKIKYYFTKKVVSKKIKNIISTNSYHIDFVNKFFLNNNVFDIAKKNYFILPNTIKNDEKVYNLDISSQKINLLTLGRMNKDGILQKGFDDLINALLLVDESILKNLNVTIIGDGDYKNYLQEKVKKYNLNITFLSNLSNKQVFELLNQNDIVCLLSRFEGHSMFALEAMYTKNILLFTKTGGLVDMVKEGFNGFLVKPQNIEEISDKIKEIVLLNIKDIEMMKNNSFKLYESNFSPETIYSKFIKILQIVKA